MKTTISIIISMTLSLSLLSGIGQLSQFAFYVCVIMNVRSELLLELSRLADMSGAASPRSTMMGMLSPTASTPSCQESTRPGLSATLALLGLFIRRSPA
ncbi:hypothetical protein [Pseudomonas aeruginosa]|uniref:hypothetical protein n=1 Tax=Pseudomonas aeruginosa TaxID=287 RepID=UPI00211B8F8E|nr:hypothetical protein [Pseudomonas aeruginosa]